MPSLSFLSILNEAIDGNCNRTSESDEQAFLEHRRPRNERQLLRSLLAEGESALHDQPDFSVQRLHGFRQVVTHVQL